MLLIGSQAMLARGLSPDRKLLDFDFISTIEEYEEEVRKHREDGTLVAAYPLSGESMVMKLKDGTINEFSIAWPGTTNEALLARHPEHRPNYVSVATLPELLMLKLSHRYRKNSPHFLKTMQDIWLLRGAGVQLYDGELELLKLREKETYTYSHPNLKQRKHEFFREDDAIYVYDHDSIHVAVASIPSKPAYTFFSKDGEEVAVDKIKWINLPKVIQLNAGLEEAYVLAIERSLVPHPGVLTPKQAFDKALMKVCTSITSGWFREFCWEHYYDIQTLYKEDYFERFQRALEAGHIKPFKGAML